ncbi:MAG: hypothetical protein DRO88_00440 [Promethearchaeia archaeon]|nr:MAG: hypothetical protein DRO88_00440 [Candidatus Lokiarchaeia archaeon]
MDSYDLLPDAPIINKGEISRFFLKNGISTFRNACLHIHEMPYGYNSDEENKWSIFEENKGSCTTKHGVIATLAEELPISVKKHVGIYRFTEEICTGAQEIIDKYQIPYIPMVHCFLVYEEHRFDLTEGNKNGKNEPIEEFIHEEEVIPFITRKDEYLLFKKMLREKILPSPEMNGISEKNLLKAREEAIKLLHVKIE